MDEREERLWDQAEFWLALAGLVVIGLILAGAASLAGHPAAAVLLAFLLPALFLLDVLAIRSSRRAPWFRFRGQVVGGGIAALGALLLGVSVLIILDCARDPVSSCPSLDGIPVEWLLLYLGAAEFVTGLRIVYHWSAIAGRPGLHGALAGIGFAATGILMLAELLASAAELSVVVLIAIVVILTVLSLALNISVWLLILGTVIGIVILGGVIGAAVERAERGAATRGPPMGPVPPTPWAPPVSPAPWGSARFCPLCGSPNVLIASPPHLQLHCNACGRDSQY